MKSQGDDETEDDHGGQEGPVAVGKQQGNQAPEDGDLRLIPGASAPGTFLLSGEPGMGVLSGATA